MDRDGTINREVGYINHPSRLELIPSAAEAIQAMNKSAFLAVVVTNQAGVAREYFGEALVRVLHQKLKSLLASEHAFLDGIYYCPHHPDVGKPPYRQSCSCRKPKPGLIEQASRELSIDCARSYMIGDKPSDMELAHNAGVKGVFVLTGYGLGEHEYHSGRWAVEPLHVAENLLTATQWILSQENQRDHG